MKAIKKVLNNIFIDGLSGMALGLFSTLIIGTILKQIGDLMGGTYGTYLSAFAVVAQRLTGAGIGIDHFGRNITALSSGNLLMCCCRLRQQE